ncbi:MAG: peptide-methionine (R)-S-oxide reductase MsrB [Betaproteobacteria bacterium]|nr:MAG: peptide-methionine (R)-S-oxide reductase MsrB [Betaproteobacteria bacterium]
MQRRDFLAMLSAYPLVLTLAQRAAAAPAKSIAEIQQRWKQLLAPGVDVATTTEPLNRSEEEWQRVLTPAQFTVLRREGTEHPFTSPLNSEKRPGVFVCAGCALPLFTSQMKYDSGTGWPSFFTLIPDRLATREDFKIIVPRTEYHCVRCGGHQGHVFDDGPPPTGLRYCNNGVALRFIPQKSV